MSNTTSSSNSVQATLGQSKKKGGFGKTLLSLLVLAALAGGGYWAYQQYIHQEAKAETLSYQTEVLKRGDLNMSITATGNLQPMNKVDIGTELSGTVAEVWVDANDVVKKGQKLASLNTDQLQDNVTKMEAALVSAQAQVTQAKAQLSQADAKIAQSEANLQQAMANARQSVSQIAQVSAQAQQDNAKIQQANAQIQQANAQVLQAKATTSEARANLGRLQELHKSSGGRLPAKSELDSAQAAFQRAQAAESAAQSSADAARANLEVAKSSINASKASLQSAKESSGASSANVEGVRANAEAVKADKITAQAQLETAKANVKQAEANLRSAKSNLEKATILSPIDGVVLSRAVEKGQTVAASLSAPTLFTLAEDLKQMELQINVDEADVGQVKEGQEAVFTVDAWPGRRYKAVITKVSLGSTLTDNVVSYLTELTVDNNDLTLRPGMTATATVSTQSRKDVLLAPNAALRFTPAAANDKAGASQGGAASGGNSGGLVSQLIARPPMQQRRQGGGRGGAGRGGPKQVWILKNGQPSAIPVKTGLSDSKFTEIIEGDIQAGSEVIIGSAGAAP
ncbi:efflux RND transporter periplasmic adaptor subunit [Thiolinea disciformis]|uniref:efflux RND transporter periplasmic adaptor subunit n=1 Tax=Thiolinea disciformis TaxID=125614 RepID=UPI000363D97C|nr:efflux RND transporter periplasmic adaptor subunit [Thiolinea disciformis]